MMVKVNNDVYVSPLHIVSIKGKPDKTCIVHTVDGQKIQSSLPFLDMARTVSGRIESLHPLCRA